MDPTTRTLRARLAAHTSWANTLDPASRTAKARSAALGRFEKRAREMHPTATDEQIARVAEQLKRAHYTAMQLKAAASRRARKASVATA
ncbi:hypothetical protein [Streptomyces sp. t39]|uniref:hypothetical protein n=1 Tax=Streptomyces sp. t39 TaxID=1828156 RepID=UPI0011CE2FBA|nr:hypothetical protein [Streptomyces sp. t39]TXS55220.1 hypothetical protein EAO77_02665 [Streptomyces sp. t39]